MEKLESTQCSAAIAVTDAWKDTSREKLYDELGWESLNLRRWSRRLILFYKIVNNLTPDYTRYPIPNLQESNYDFADAPQLCKYVQEQTVLNKASIPTACWNGKSSILRSGNQPR